MAGSTLKKTRRSAKQSTILDTLRRRITEGDLTPGTRLPTRVELEKRFAVSTTTMQRAVDRLAQEGFVQAQGKRGTFVVEHPPHLSRYGVVFPTNPSDSGWRRFWTVVSAERERMEQFTAKQLPQYYDIQSHTDTQHYQSLVRDIQLRRLAGLVFMAWPWGLERTPVLTAPGVPRVAVANRPKMEGISVVDLDRWMFIQRAVDYLAQRGRRRLAILTVTGQPPEPFVEAAVQRGMTVEPYWVHTMGPSHPQIASSLAHLLMAAPGRMRPDAMVISDDNLVGYALAGLVQAGTRVPDELEVVAHCNFPQSEPSAMPVQRLGYDIRQLLATCIELIDQQRDGNAVEKQQLPAVFEDEFVASYSPHATATMEPPA